jgi:hypothetical protein
VTEVEIIRAFEAGLVSGDSFHHADHVHLAFAYLSTFPVFTALERFSSALKRFAAANGKPRLYNETVTCAYFFLINERIARTKHANWEEFSASNTDLICVEKWRSIPLLSRDHASVRSREKCFYPSG